MFWYGGTGDSICQSAKLVMSSVEPIGLRCGVGITKSNLGTWVQLINAKAENQLL